VAELNKKVVKAGNNNILLLHLYKYQGLLPVQLFCIKKSTPAKKVPVFILPAIYC
jgi:hypothetical protein